MRCCPVKGTGLNGVNKPRGRALSCLVFPVRCEVEEADKLEQASPMTEVVMERGEGFYYQCYVNDKEKAASEVSLSKSQLRKPPNKHTTVTVRIH